MPRSARKESGCGIYHVMMRGINRQAIFDDDESRIRETGAFLRNILATVVFLLARHSLSKLTSSSSSTMLIRAWHCVRSCIGSDAALA